MAPRVKKQRKDLAVRPAIEVDTFNRKCRSCGRWAKVASNEPCPHCRQPYGKLVLGEDLPKDVAPAADAHGFPVPEQPL